MTAAAPSPTRNRSTARRRPSCNSTQSPTASRYGRIFGARSPPGPTDAAAAPAFPDDPDPALRLARRPPSRPCNTMAKRHPASREAGSKIPASRSSSRPAAPPSTMPSPCLNHPAPHRTTNAAPSTCTTAFTTPCFTSESRSAMTAAAPSPTRNRSTARRRPSCSSTQSPTASRYGRIFGARSPPGPTDAAAAPAFPTIPIRQFALLADRCSRPCNATEKCYPASCEASSEIPASRSSSRPAAPPSTMPSPRLNRPAPRRTTNAAPSTCTTAFTTPPSHVRVMQCNDGDCDVAHTECIGRETAAVLQFGSISDDPKVRQNFWCRIAARANGRRGSTRRPDDPDPAVRPARRPLLEAMQRDGKVPPRVVRGWLRNSRQPLVFTACRTTVDDA